MRSRRYPALLTGVVVAVLAGIGLTAVHHAPRPAIAPRVAIGAALHNPPTRGALVGSHWTRVTATALDGRTERVSFFAGSQIVAEVAVESGGRVVAGVNDRMLRVPYGDWIAYQPALIVGLCALFVLMAGVAPWRRLRNLDVAACLSLAIAVVLFQHRYVDPSMLTAACGLAYLLVRCAYAALGPARRASRSTPLITAITPGLDPAGRTRWLRRLLVAVGLVVTIIGLSSTDPVDVVYAVMEGATRLTHGVLPYGHMPPGVLHGDTYPILSYAFYVPLALLTPVSNLWDSVALGLAVAVVAALVAAWAMSRTVVTRGGARASGRTPEAEEAGLRAALAWLAFPPVLITVSTGTTDVALGGMLAIAILLWRRPTWCAGMLALAGWFKLAPLALLPVRLAPLRGRRLVAPLAAVALVSLLSLGVLVALGGVRGPADMLHAIAYQFSRGSYQSIWGALGIPGLQPLGQAGVLGLVAGAVVKLRREPSLSLDRARMAALAAAIVIGLQLAADYWAFLYVAWVVPLIGCSVLSECALIEAAPEPSTQVAGRLEPAGAVAA